MHDRTSAANWSIGRQGRELASGSFAAKGGDGIEAGGAAGGEPGGGQSDGEEKRGGEREGQWVRGRNAEELA